jgi:hypothetical protein
MILSLLESSSRGEFESRNFWFLLYLTYTGFLIVKSVQIILIALYTLFERLKSWSTSTNFFARLSPECDPFKIQKSKIVDCNCHSLLIQCIQIPRNGSWFLLIYASIVNENKLDVSYFLILI